MKNHKWGKMALALECLAGRFRGCLVGSLIGDCLGAPFEFDNRTSVSVLNKYFQKMSDPKLKSM